MKDNARITKTKFPKTMLSLVLLGILLLGVVLINYTAYHSIDIPNTTVAIPLNGLFFLLLGMTLISLSVFIFAHFSHYRTGKYFLIYAILIGLSLSLAPCAFFNPFLKIAGDISALISSFFLYQTVGLLTQLQKKNLYRFFSLILMLAIALGIVAQFFPFIGIENIWFNRFLSESSNISVLLCILFSIATMLVYYRRSNTYAKKLMKILLVGISVGFLIFMLAYNLPYMYAVQISPLESATNIEITFSPSLSLVSYIPLLLFSGVSTAIVLVLFKREFISVESRVSIIEYIGVAVYLFIANAILFLYASMPVGLLVCFNVVLGIPLVALFYRLLRRQYNSEEETYQWKLLKELENERQQLSAFLHDEVLQSIIAYYRQIQAEQTDRYEDMKEHLLKLISQIRRVSHNLYPTIVEDVGLEQSIQYFITELDEGNPHIKISYDYKIGTGALPKTILLSFYRIVRELVTNAVKHSACETVYISLTENETGFFIRVNDNGHGFSLPDNETLLSSSHMGLYTVKKQVAELKGQMSVQSNDTVGTDFHIYFPGKEVLLNVD